MVATNETRRLYQMTWDKIDKTTSDYGQHRHRQIPKERRRCVRIPDILFDVSVVDSTISVICSELNDQDEILSAAANKNSGIVQ